MKDDTSPSSPEQRAHWVAQVNANMSISGKPVDAFTQEKQCRYIAGELAVEDMVKETMAAFQAEQAAQEQPKQE